MNLTEWKDKIAGFLKTSGGSFAGFWSKLFKSSPGIKSRENGNIAGGKKDRGAKGNRINGNSSNGKNTKSGGVLDNFRSSLSRKFKFFTDWFTRSFGSRGSGENRDQVWKRRLMIFGFGGFALLILIFLIAILALNAGQPKENPANSLASGPSVASEELFIPAEPDFLPKFILEREPRRFWSLEDIRPYWKSPADSAASDSLQSDPERWRGEIRSAVDKLLEGVP